jgi:release factor glutamine methyltransferase
MKEIVSHIVSELKDFYPTEEAQELAYWIIEETTGITRTQIYMGHPKKTIPNLPNILEQLQQHTPIQYIFGHTQWMGLDLCVDSSTLIPRPETAELVDWITSSCDNKVPLQVLDIGTGSGCIAIALKRKCPNWQVQGVDISAEALSIAKENGERNNVQVSWHQMDILAEKPDLKDIIVSNPPYICHKEKSLMDERVLAHEPHTALFVPDSDPLLFYRRIASMKSAKSLYFEINEAYGDEVCAMMKTLGYSDVTLKYDMYGKPRMVFGRIKA